MSAGLNVRSALAASPENGATSPSLRGERRNRNRRTADHPQANPDARSARITESGRLVATSGFGKTAIVRSTPRKWNLQRTTPENA
jgi:hypothetical protein